MHRRQPKLAIMQIILSLSPTILLSHKIATWLFYYISHFSKLSNTFTSTLINSIDVKISQMSDHLDFCIRPQLCQKISSQPYGTLENMTKFTWQGRFVEKILLLLKKFNKIIHPFRVGAPKGCKGGNFIYLIHHWREKRGLQL